MIQRIDQAIQWLQDGYGLSLQDNELERDTWATSLKKRFSARFASEETLKVTAWLEKKLPFSGVVERPKLLELSHNLIKKSLHLKPIQKELLRFDHLIGRFMGYEMKENRGRLEKWTRYGFDPKIYERETDFVQFLFNSPLASQMKISRDTIEMVGGEPAILVEGVRTKYSDLQQRFTYKYSPSFKESFIFEKSTNEVFTYLATGKGLVKHNPYLANPMTPIAKLSKAEYAEVLKRARSFIRPEETEKQNEKREFVLQVVSNEIHKWNDQHPITGNFAKLFRRAQHPFLRLIDPEGNVAEMGFNWGTAASCQVLATDRGRFRGPDIWEYICSDEQVTTSIAVDALEARKFQEYVLQYYNEGVHFGRWPAFHFMHQNCSTFVPAAVYHATGIKIPHNITFSVALARIAPPLLQAIGRAIKTCYVEVKKATLLFTPQPISSVVSFVAQKIRKVWESMIAFYLAIMTFFLGNGQGEGGRRFGNLDKDQKLEPPLQNLRKWFDLSQYRFDSPTLIQEWQRTQPSTSLAHKKVRLSF